MNSTHTQKIVFTQAQVDVIYKVLSNGALSIQMEDTHDYTIRNSNPTTLQKDFLNQAVWNTYDYNHLSSSPVSCNFYNIKLYNENTLKQKLNLSTYKDNELIYLYLIIKINAFYLCNINSKVLGRVIEKLKLFLITNNLEEYI